MKLCVGVCECCFPTAVTAVCQSLWLLYVCHCVCFVTVTVTAVCLSLSQLCVCHCDCYEYLISVTVDVMWPFSCECFVNEVFRSSWVLRRLWCLNGDYVSLMLWALCPCFVSSDATDSEVSLSPWTLCVSVTANIFFFLSLWRLCVRLGKCFCSVDVNVVCLIWLLCVCYCECCLSVTVNAVCQFFLMLSVWHCDYWMSAAVAAVCLSLVLLCDHDF